MRKALALAAFLAMAPYAQAQTEGGAAVGTFTPSAEYRLRFQYDNNISGSEDIEPTSQNHFRQRMKLGGTFKATDQLSATVTLLHNAVWGTDGASGDSKAQLNGIGGEVAGASFWSTENLLLVQEAYGTWMVSDEFTLRFGRGSFTFGDGTVIHDNDWEATPYSFEGILGTYEMEMGRLSGFFVRFADYIDGIGTASDQDPQANAVGLTYSHKTLPDFLSRADVHVIQNNQSFIAPGSTSSYGQDILRYGISLGGDVSLIDWRAAYNAHTGKYVTAIAPSVTKVDADGHMYEIEVGAKFEEFMNSRVYVLYHQDSGDDGDATNGIDTYDPYFYSKHYNSGLMDVVYWGNLTDMAVGWTFEPADATTVGLHYHMFQKTDADGGVNSGLWGDMIAAGGLAGDKDIGQEVDLVATHTYDNGLMVLGRLGMFMPGDALKDGTPERKDTYSTAFIEAKMNF